MLYELTEYGDLGEELLVHLALPDGRPHEDPAVGIAVDPPELDVCARLDGGRARGAVDERQLAETPALADVQDLLAVDEHLRKCARISESER